MNASEFVRHSSRTYTTLLRELSILDRVLFHYSAEGTIKLTRAAEQVARVVAYADRIRPLLRRPTWRARAIAEAVDGRREADVIPR
jgi:hypothetical protein